MTAKTPADTLAALADKLDLLAKMEGTGWIGRIRRPEARRACAHAATELRALASLKGEAAPPQQREGGKVRDLVDSLVSRVRPDCEAAPWVVADLKSIQYAVAQPAQQPGEVAVTDEMVERGLAAAVEASDARLPRYSVVRQIITAALTTGGRDDG